MKDYWSQYWQQGQLTSFGDNIKENYRGELKQAWLNFYGNLLASDKLLDIGTGNGALIALALDNQGDCKAKFDGVDYAELNVQVTNLKDKPNVVFYPETNAEKLPFSDASYTHVISQFALEYTQLENSIAEVSRVLATNGKFQFICHTDQSIIVKPNAEILFQAKALLAPLGLLSTCEKLSLLICDPFKRGSEEAESLREKLNSGIQKAMTEDQQAFVGTNFPGFVRAVFATSDKDQKIAMFKSFKTELIGQINRLQDLINAALDESKKLQILSLLETQGLTVKQCDYIRQDNQNILGIIVQGTK